MNFFAEFRVTALIVHCFQEKEASRLMPPPKFGHIKKKKFKKERNDTPSSGHSSARPASTPLFSTLSSSLSSSLASLSSNNNAHSGTSATANGGGVGSNSKGSNSSSSSTTHTPSSSNNPTPMTTPTRQPHQMQQHSHGLPLHGVTMSAPLNAMYASQLQPHPGNNEGLGGSRNSSNPNLCGLPSANASNYRLPPNAPPDFGLPMNPPNYGLPLHHGPSQRDYGNDSDSDNACGFGSDWQ